MCNEYPPTKVVPVTENLHGVEVTDPYRWLEDKDSPEVKEWIAKQNAFTESVFEKIGMTEEIEQRLQSMLRYDVLGYSRFTPTFSGSRSRYFYTYRRADENRLKLCYQDSEQGERQIIFDPLEISPEGDVAIDWFYPSWDGRFITYGISESGSEESILYVYDVDNSRLLNERIPRTKFCSVAWLNDNSGFYYTRNPLQVKSKKRHYNKHVFFHRLGADHETDQKIHGEGLDPAALPSIITNKDNTHIVTIWQRFTAINIYIAKIRDNPGKLDFTPLIVDDSTKNYPQITKEHLYVLTEYETPNRKIVRFRLDNIGSSTTFNDAEIVVDESENIISEFVTFGRFIAVIEDIIAHSRLKVYHIESKETYHVIECNNPVSFSDLRNYPGQSRVYYTRSSFFTPSRLEFYETSSGSCVFFEPSIDFREGSFVARQVWYTSKDETEVPMFLVHKKGLNITTETPVLLTGYGGFGISKKPFFMPPYCWWIEMGGVYAIANIRGGGELGQEWHMAGIRENKQNTIDDFIAAIEWLTSNGYGSSDSIGISGGSNGGLLVGATLVQRPDIIRSVYCSTPLLDMLRYHHFHIARYWIPEFGNPDDPDDFQWLMSYSPYSNVQNGVKYPAVLFHTADRDTRVDSSHALKMAAIMQSSTSGILSENPILFWQESRAGHVSGKSIDQFIKQWGRELSFHAYHTGLLKI